MIENKDFKRPRSSRPIRLICSSCNGEVLDYWKVGKGGLLRLYLRRIEKSHTDLGPNKALKCKFCGEILGNLAGSKDFYRMTRGKFKIREKNK